MAGWEGRSLWRTIISIFIFVYKVHGTQPLFKDLPSHVLLHHIAVSRQLPLCLLLREQGTGSRLEKVLHRLWKDKDFFHNTSSWEVGSYTFNKEPDEILKQPTQFPSLRCYLGETIAYDYDGKAAKSQLAFWFQKLFSLHSEHQLDIAEETVTTAIKTHRFTLIAFPNLHIHKTVEEILHQISYESEEHIKSLVVHPHSERRKEIQKMFDVVTLPVAVVVHNREDESDPTVKVFTEHSLRKANIETYIQAQRIPTTHLDVESFKKSVLDTSSHPYTPYLVCFYAFWAPEVSMYLRFFSLTVQDFQELDLALRFGLVNLSEQKNLVGRYIDPMKARSFPFILLFTKDETTGQIIQTLLTTKRPSPFSVYQELQSMGVQLVTHTGQPVVYQPYGMDQSKEVSALYEGPYGLMCSTNYHNTTENLPQRRIFKKKVKKMKKKKDWYGRHVFDEIDASLSKEDGIPVVSHSTWSQVIDKSHAPRHPFYLAGRWAGEYTKVAMIVFLIEGCGSCRRNWEVFKQLHQAVKFVDGGAFYIANCTADPHICVQHGVTGFPTIITYRGSGWLGNSHCVSAASEPLIGQSIRLDYHGVILEKPIMEWFSQVSSPAVYNYKHDPLPLLENTDEDVRLVGVLMPKFSKFLPKSLQPTPEMFYPYQCFRLACERLYGQARCYSVYNTQVPRSEFTEEELDVVVIKVRLERRDGVSVDITQVGRYLHSTISQEHGPHLDTFHKPHRYNLGSTEKCEDDHAACTDLLISFTRDHARLPLTHLTATAFHTKNNPLFEDNLPVMLSLVHQDNITSNAEFFQILQEAGTRLYRDLAVVSVDVDLYPDWVSKFVPAGYTKQSSVETEVPSLYHYPRLCIVDPRDHHHAAFYPPVHVDIPSFTYKLDGVLTFANNFLKSPQSYLVPTEHF